MAIDPRISLATAQPLNVGQRFGGVLQNLQSLDALQRQRELAPLQQQQAQMQVDLLAAQQPAQLQAAQLAASPEAQIINQQQQQQQIATQYAQRLKPFIDSGDAQGLANQILTTKQEFDNLGINTAGMDDDLQQITTPQGLESLSQEINSVLQLGGLTQARKPTQFGAQQTFKDEKGNLFFGTQARDPSTGDVSTRFSPVSGDQSVAPQGQLSLVSGLGQTASEKAGTEIQKTLEVENVKAKAKGSARALEIGVAAAQKAFEKLPLVRTAIGNYDDAIAELDAGAETGTIDRLLPSLTEAGKTLDNTIKRLGLDVVGNTTFGALSESELDFALQAAIPDGLQPQELKRWLVAKKNAQQKILSGLNEMVDFLGAGDKTLKDWNNLQAINKLSGVTQPEAVDQNEFTGFKVIR